MLNGLRNMKPFLALMILIKARAVMLIEIKQVLLRNGVLSLFGSLNCHLMQKVFWCFVRMRGSGIMVRNGSQILLSNGMVIIRQIPMICQQMNLLIVAHVVIVMMKM